MWPRCADAPDGARSESSSAAAASGPGARRLRTQRFEEAHGGQDAEARGALRMDAVRPLDEGRAGDVEMRPLAPPDELAQEERRADRAAVGLAGVLEVGDVALQRVAEIFHERQAPHRLTRLA